MVTWRRWRHRGQRAGRRGSMPRRAHCEPLSAARITRKAVTGPPHAGASAPTILAGTGLIAPAPGYHYMATGELMKDPD